MKKRARHSRETIMGVYNPRPAQVGQTQVNAVNGFAPAPAMPQNGFAQQGPMPQPNPMRQTVPQPGVPQGPMPAQQQPNPMLGGAGMQQPGQPSMTDRLMSPMGQIGLSMMAQGPSLTPVNPMAGIGTALGNSITYQRQKNADTLAAQERQANEQEKLANQERLNSVASYYAQRFGDDEAQVRDLFAAGMGEAYIESRTGGSAGLSMKEQATQANTLRDDLNKELQTVNLVNEGAQTIQTLYENPGAISDYALVVAFAKIVDPGSVARNEEVQAVQNAAARLPAYMQQIQNAFTGDGSLTPEVKNEIMRLAAQMANKRIQSGNETIAGYKRTSDEMGVPWSWVRQGGEYEAVPVPDPIKKDGEPGDVDMSQFQVRPVVAEQPAAPIPQRGPVVEFDPSAPQNKRRNRRAGQRNMIIEAD
jgi:uncharacterized protein YkwD